MRSKIVFTLFAVTVAILLSFLPIYPVLMEGRQFTQTGESLYQEWRLVSIGGFLDYSHYAGTAWLNSTKIAYVFLSIINSLILLSLSWVTAIGLQRVFVRFKKM